MQVDIIRDEPGFLALESVWNSSLQKSGADTIFLTFEWLSAWWNYFGAGNRLFVLAVKNAGETAGLFPLMITDRNGFRLLAMMGGGVSDYKDFIIGECENRERVIGAMFDAIINDGSWDFFQLNGFREDSPNFEPFQSVLSRLRPYGPVFQPTDISPYIPLNGSWESYWNSLNRTFRTDSRRRMKLLTEAKGPVTYRRPADRKEVETYMAVVIKQHAARMRNTARTGGGFEKPAMSEFSKDLAGRLYALKWLSLPVLLAGNEIAAAHFGFEYAEKYYYYIPTFEEGFSRFAAGRLLALHLVQNAFAQGLREFDFLLGDEPYKFDFKPKIRKLYSVALFQKTLKGYAAKNMRRLNSWLLKTGIRTR